MFHWKGYVLMPNFMKGATRRVSPREINGDVFKSARLAQDLSFADLANQATLSAKQVEQIENGESGSFYSLKIKNTAAIKLAKILSISDDEIFKEPIAPIVQAPEFEPQIQSELESGDMLCATNQSPAAPISVIESQRIVIPNNVKKVGRSPAYGFLALLVIAYPAYLVFGEHRSSMPGSASEVSAISGDQDTDAIDAPITPSLDAVTVPAIPEKAKSVPTSMSKGCDTDGTKPREYKASYPSKPGSYVYMLSKDDHTLVCIEDAAGKVDKKELIKGVGINFSGTPPFKVTSKTLNQVEIYFQGSRVPVAEMDNAILLSEVPSR